MIGILLRILASLRIFFLYSVTLKTLPLRKPPSEPTDSALENWVCVSSDPNGRSKSHGLDFGCHAMVSVIGGTVINTPRISGILSGKKFLLPPVTDAPPWKIVTSKPIQSGFVYSDGSNLILKKYPRVKRLKSAVFVGTWSPHNWFHWMIDIVPAVFRACEILPEPMNVPILLPRISAEKKHWFELLALVAGNRELIWMPPENWVEVEKLYWSMPATSSGPLSNKPGWPANFAIEIQLMNRYRNAIVNKLQIEADKSLPKRLFLARSQSGLRPYNQEEIISVAREFDFQPVFPESMDLSDLFQLFFTAEFLIGPHGAGWANVLLCETPKAGMLWTWNQAAKSNWFQNVSASRGMNLEIFFTGPGTNSSAYHLNPKLFRSKLEKLMTTRT